MSRYVKHSIFWVLALAFVISTTAFTFTRRARQVCNKVEVVIRDSVKNKFVEKTDIMRILQLNEEKILGYAMIGINTCVLEENIKKYPPVKRSEAFILANGTLCIEVWQREPIVRIISRDNKSFYLDMEGKILPLSDKYTSHVLVANGNISMEGVKIKNDFSICTDSVKAKNMVLQQVFDLAQYMYQDEFLKNQIMQLFVNNDKEFELIPRIGNQIIFFGDGENYAYKCKKLKALYLMGFNNLGWNLYSTINVKYSNQIICTKI